MIIENASLSEAGSIARLHRAARQEAMPWLPDLHTPEEELWFFRTIVLPYEKVMVARRDRQIFGFISLKGEWLNHLYVAPGSWGHGVGTKLLETARSDVNRLQLWVFQQNDKAQRFYADRGFHVRETTDGQRNEEKAPDVRMEWIRGC